MYGVDTGCNSEAIGSKGRIAMRRLSVIAVALIIGLSVVGGAPVAYGQSDAGWITLIEGTAGLQNWNRLGDANWRAEEGAIVADQGMGGFLVSKDSYAD